MKNLFLHYKTITRHRHLVIHYCIKAGIFFQGLGHDLSKYSPAEFIPGVRYYEGFRSPNAKEREVTGYSLAWMHHKGRNRHHYEYWTDYSPVTRRLEPVEMPRKYLAEMICDRIAASRIYKGDKYDDTMPLAYLKGGIDHIKMHPNTAERLEYFLSLLAEQGEEAMFAELKEYVRQK